MPRDFPLPTAHRPLPSAHFPPVTAMPSAVRLRRILLIASILLGVAFAGAGVGVYYWYRSAAARQGVVRCRQNLRAVGQALLAYAHDERRMAFPPDLRSVVAAGRVSPDRLVCPATADTPAPGGTPQQQAAALTPDGDGGGGGDGGRHVSYAYVPGASAVATYGTVVAYEPLTNHAGRGIHVLDAQGVVYSVPAGDAERVIAELTAGQNPPPTLRRYVDRPGAEFNWW